MIMSSCQIPCIIFRLADRFARSAVTSVNKYLTNGNKCINSLSYLQYIFPRLINNRPRSINEVLKQEIRTPLPNTFVFHTAACTARPRLSQSGASWRVIVPQVRQQTLPPPADLKSLQTLVPHKSPI